MAIKILAAADLHLGKRSSGLPDDATDISTKYTWDQLVRWAIDNEVDVVALSGDIVDQENGYFEAVGPLQAGLNALGQAGIEVFIVAGNHDYKVLPPLINVQLPHVHLLGRAGEWQLVPFTKNGETVQFVGWSFPHQYVKVSPLGTIGRLNPDPNHAVIGLLHADLDIPDSIYCPVSRQDLVATGIRTWVLGHIHKPCALDLAGTTIHYPGSLQAQSAKEPGAHGFLLMTVLEKDRINIEPVFLSTVRYERLDVDISRADTRETLWELIHSAAMTDARRRLPELDNVRHLTYDLIFTGEHANGMQVKGWAEASQGDLANPVSPVTTVYIRKVSSAIRPAVGNLRELSGEPSPAGMLASLILAIRENRSTPLLSELEEKWRKAERNLSVAAVYQPLTETGAMEPADAREYLIKELNRSLTELLLQKSTMQ
ncbi:metallophosphoesterase family protein [Puia dinghuensis]|uniref:Serine/threonine protein phosphatase n=1 Tax=Puia dinghuensis TaxID=1792502 RepID=A0A8J2U6D3_9BACT|nr:DNA repair exonuclease [Puia dinghuensis]GGA81770.1 serine/threonine protein phosphatase [Puia dinghuensis]